MALLLVDGQHLVVENLIVEHQLEVDRYVEQMLKSN
jgi:hypothetical protein